MYQEEGVAVVIFAGAYELALLWDDFGFILSPIEKLPSNLCVTQPTVVLIVAPAPFHVKSQMMVSTAPAS